MAAKLVLISFDSTLRSNLSVGMPIDLLIYEKDSIKLRAQVTLQEDDPYFAEISRRWSEVLRTTFAGLPDPDF